MQFLTYVSYMAAPATLTLRSIDTIQHEKTNSADC